MAAAAAVAGRRRRLAGFLLGSLTLLLWMNSFSPSSCWRNAVRPGLELVAMSQNMASTRVQMKAPRTTSTVTISVSESLAELGW